MIRINSKKHAEYSEVGIFGDKDDFIALNKLFTDAKGADKVMIEENESASYPVPVSAFSVVPLKDSSGLLNVKLNDQSLVIEGDANAFRKFSNSLNGLVALEYGSHFHIDYFEGNDLISKCDLYIVLYLSER